MLPMITALLSKAKDNPVGLVLAAVALVLYKGGEAMPEDLEPFRAIVMGLGGVMVLVAGAWIGRAKKPPEPPPPGPPAAPEPPPDQPGPAN